jgi:hypothetical protein
MNTGKVSSGLRPKKKVKPNDIQNNETGLSLKLPISSTTKSSSSSSSSSSLPISLTTKSSSSPSSFLSISLTQSSQQAQKNRNSSNPFDSLCELLLPWKILDDISSTNSDIKKKNNDNNELKYEEYQYIISYSGGIGVRKSPSSTSEKTNEVLKFKEIFNSSIYVMAGGIKYVKFSSGWIPEKVGNIEIIRLIKINKINQLPITYSSICNYQSKLEPLLIDEMKANILSSIPFNTRNKSKSGTVILTVEKFDLRSELGRINCNFNDRDKDLKDNPGSMDLLLLSQHPIQPPLTRETLSSLLHGASSQVVLGLVQHHVQGSRGIGGVQLKVHKNTWEEMISKWKLWEDIANDISINERTNDVFINERTNDVSINERRQMNVKDTNKRINITSSIYSSNGTAYNNSNSKVTSNINNNITNNNNSKVTSNINIIPLSKSLIDNTISSMDSKPNPSRRRRGLYSMHYIIIDSLISSWREFKALHDLGDNDSLLINELLGSMSYLSF